jgi:hypothetical protein
MVQSITILYGTIVGYVLETYDHRRSYKLKERRPQFDKHRQERRAFCFPLCWEDSFNGTI